MNKVITSKIMLFGAILLMLPAIASAQAESAVEPAIETESVVPEETLIPEAPMPIITMTQAIAEAKVKLEAERLKRLEIWGGKGPVYSEFPATAEIILAVWRQDAQVVNLYLADKQGTNLRIKSAGAPPIRVSHHARFYSRYSIPVGNSATVVGVLYPVMDEIGDKFHTREAIHIPLTGDMFTPEMFAAGANYLSNVVMDAYSDLRERGIMSKSYPGRLLADVIDPYLVKSVVVIEHSNHHQLLSDDDPESVLGAFYVTLAANRELAFSEAESNAGALGLAQFIPSTYALFVRNRPDLGLIPDFRQGMADHRNAIVAEVAYFDDSLRLLPEEIRSGYLVNPAMAADYLAAAYNGGVTRVRRAYMNFDDTWDQYHGGDYSLRQETVLYVKKLRKVYSMLASGVYATPSVPDNALPVDANTAAATGQGNVASANPLSTVCFGDGSCVALN